MTGIWLISYITLWVLFLILAVVVLLTLRSLSVVVETVKQLHQGDDDTPTKLVVGEQLPDVALSTPDGTPSSLYSLPGMATAVLVLSPGCGPCHEVVSAIRQARSASDPLDLQVARTVLIGTGAAREVHDDLRLNQLADTLPVFIDTERAVWAQWGVRGTPTTITVNAQWQVVQAATGLLPRADRANRR